MSTLAFTASELTLSVLSRPHPTKPLAALVNKLRQRLKILKRLERKDPNRYDLRPPPSSPQRVCHVPRTISTVKGRRDCHTFTPIVGERQLRFNVRAVIPAAGASTREWRVVLVGICNRSIALLLLSGLVAEQSRKESVSSSGSHRAAENRSS